MVLIREARLFNQKVRRDKNFENSFKSAALKLSYEPDELQDISNTTISNIENVLNSPEYISITKEFKEYKKRNGKHAKWYSIDGPSNLCELAEKLGRDVDYFIHYRHLSRITHAMVHEDHVDIQEGTLKVNPIRNLLQIDKVISASINFILNIYAVIVQNYRQGEKEQFSKTYLNKWRAHYAFIKEVKYVDPQDENKAN